MNLPAPSFFLLSILFLIPIILIVLDIIALSDVIVTAMLIFWALMMFFDISYTINNKKFLKFESSFILSFFIKKTRLYHAVLLTIICEIGIILSSSFIFVHTFDMQIISIVGVIVGIIHIDGLYKTRKFINSYNM